MVTESLGASKVRSAQAFFHVNEDVGQLAVVGHDGLGLVVALAGRVLAHVNLLPLWEPPVELHGAADAGRRAGSIGVAAGAGFTSELGEVLCSSLVFSFLLQPASNSPAGTSSETLPPIVSYS